MKSARRRRALLVFCLAMAATVPASPAPSQASGCLPGETGHDRIAFARTSPGNQGIWTIRTDGSDLRRVTSMAGDTRPAWSPDGTRIAFTRRGSGDFEVFVVNADGTGERNLTSRPGIADVMPAWSPDGAWIAYHSAPYSMLGPGSDTGRIEGDFEILVASADGAVTRNLSQRPAAFGEVGDRAAADVKPAWSPDGRWIAFESYRGLVNSDTYNSEIWAMPTDPAATAADAVQLTDTLTSAEWFPSWSPDGTRVAFMRQPHGGSFEIWVLTLAADGTVTAESRLTNNTKNDWNPSWSPDGARIAFASNRPDGGFDVGVTGIGLHTNALGSDPLAPDTWDIYLMNADGSCPTRLTHLGDVLHPAYL